MGLEPTRAEHNGLAVHRLNLSATSSIVKVRIYRRNDNTEKRRDSMNDRTSVRSILGNEKITSIYVYHCVV